ncbi:MAG TPA: site-2 protease family protein [Candidatus Limnocylindrales bacterium]|nr:site-2 protease family protein [Candidatus Limnocylindrales bacterium]
MDEALLQRLIAAAIIILISFPVHEFSHAFAAFKLGDSTARYQGRLTLNPAKHFDPLGGILLLLGAVVGGFLIGWAKPTPVNPINLRGGRRSEALVALAGPLSNLILAALVAIPLRIILMTPEMRGAVGSNELAVFLFGVAETFVFINLILMVFNLLPIPPLDGWHVLLSLVNPRTAYTLRQYEQYGFIIIVILIVSGVTIVGDVVSTLQRWLIGS